MSTTRSPSRAAPATDPRGDPARWADSTLLLVGHGSERDPAPAAALEAHAEALRRGGLFQEVRTAFLYGAPDARAAEQGLSGRHVYVMPVFMCDGLFVRKTVPERFGLGGSVTQRQGRQWYQCPPVGLADGLPQLIDQRLRAAADKRNTDPRRATLLLIGHGSLNSPASWQATEEVARRLRTVTPFQRVVTAYLEQSPRLSECLPDLDGPVFMCGLFAADGSHAATDIPRIVADVSRSDLHYLGPIGKDVDIPQLIVEQVAAADANR